MTKTCPENGRRITAVKKTDTGWKGGLRFQKRIRLGRWLTLNLSRDGASVSVGVRGLRINVGRRGFFITLGVPGSGWSYRGGFPWRRAKRSPRVWNDYQEDEGDEPWKSMMS